MAHVPIPPSVRRVQPPMGHLTPGHAARSGPTFADLVARASYNEEAPDYKTISRQTRDEAEAWNQQSMWHRQAFRRSAGNRRYCDVLKAHFWCRIAEITCPN